MEKCFFCNKEQYKEQFIKEYKFWNLILNINQYYLGRIIISLKEHKEDFLDSIKEEREELFEIIKEITATLEKVFNPDMFNYAILMNQDRHLHVHFISRYKDERIFENIRFRDENWGHNPFSQNKFQISKMVFNKIKEKIKDNLKWK